MKGIIAGRCEITIVPSKGRQYCDDQLLIHVYT